MWLGMLDTTLADLLRLESQPLIMTSLATNEIHLISFLKNEVLETKMLDNQNNLWINS